MGGSRSKQDEALFKVTYPSYERGIKTSEIIKLGIPPEKVADFIKYSKERRKEELRIETAMHLEMSNQTREVLGLAPEMETPMSPTQRFTLAKFNAEFNDPTERAALEILFNQSRTDSKALDLLLDGPEHREFAERYALYADFREYCIDTPTTPSPVFDTQADSKRRTSRLFKFFGNQPPANTTAPNEAPEERRSRWFGCCG